MRWGIYCRLSHVARDERDELRSEAAIERQEDACRAMIAARDPKAEVVCIYSDEGLSAFKRIVRPEFDRALNDLDCGHIDALAAFKVDRLCRSHEDLGRLWDVIQRSGGVLAAVHDTIDTSTPAGESMLRTVVGLARMESANIGLRVAAQREQAARKGVPGYGGPRPWCFEADKVTVVAAEAAVVRDAARRLLAGESLRGVASSMNAEGHRTTTGKLWTHVRLREALSRPRMAGLREHNGVVVFEDAWPAVLDRDTWEQLRALFDGRRRLVGRPRTFLLVGGPARCGAPGADTIGDVEGICGRPLVSGRRGDDKSNARRYLCPPTTGGGCGGVTIVKDALEDLVRDAVISGLAGPGLARALAATATDADAELGRGLAEDEEMLRNLALMRARKEIGPDEWLIMRGEVEGRIVRTRRRLANLADKGVLASLPQDPGDRERHKKLLRAEWEKATLDRRRAIAEAVLLAVVVHPMAGRGRKPIDRVTLAWKV
jgi:DNA invertase Pin-like site-specific DNA recombinase